MQYTAIIKEDGLFIPNVFTDTPIDQPTIEVNLELPLNIQPYQAHMQADNNSKQTNNQAAILSFAGVWQDLDEDILSANDIEQRRLQSLKER